MKLINIREHRISHLVDVLTLDIFQKQSLPNQLNILTMVILHLDNEGVHGFWNAPIRNGDFFHSAVTSRQL